VKRAVNSTNRLSGTPAGSRSTWPGREPIATSIPALKPDSEIVSGGKGIISEFPTLRILRVMTTPELYNVIQAGHAVFDCPGDSRRRRARQRDGSSAIPEVAEVTEEARQMRRDRRIAHYALPAGTWGAA